MDKFLKCLLASVCLCSPASAQIISPILWTHHNSSAPASYTGPGDVDGNWTIWVGLRAYSSATRGNNAIQACDVGDAHCVNIPTDATTGALVGSTVVGSGACNTSTNVCTVKTMYDQSGNAHNCTQATEASRPKFEPTSGPGGKPRINFGVSANWTLSCASLPTTAVPWTFVAAWATVTTPAGNGRVWVAADPTGIIYNPSNQFAMYGGSLAASTFTASTSTYYAVAASNDATGAAATLDVSGHIDTGLAPSNGSTGTPGAIMGLAAPVDGWGLEFGINSTFMTSTRVTLISNIQTYWGI